MEKNPYARTFWMFPYLKDINDCFLDTFLSCNLEQIVDFPTRGTNTLEIVATNRPNLVNKCTPNMGISDHETTILLDMNCHAKEANPPPPQTPNFHVE